METVLSILSLVETQEFRLFLPLVRFLTFSYLTFDLGRNVIPRDGHTLVKG
jgi:hypothetical protein